MKLDLRRRLITAALFASALSFFSSAAWSQKSLEQMRASFQELQAGLARVEKTQRITADYNFDAALDKYVEDAADAYQDALKAAEGDAKNRKSAGGLQHLQAFEALARQQKTQLEGMVPRITTIGVRVRQGYIAVDAGVLKDANDEEIKAFQDWLTPRQRQRYQKIDPRITTSSANDHTHPWTVVQAEFGGGCAIPSAQQTSEPFGLARDSLAYTVLDSATDLFLPKAYASLGLGCYAICHASLGLGCLSCVISAGGAVFAAYKTYQSWVKSCGSCHWYKPWACACRAAAAATFIAALA